MIKETYYKFEVRFEDESAYNGMISKFYNIKADGTKQSYIKLIELLEKHYNLESVICIQYNGCLDICTNEKSPSIKRGFLFRMISKYHQF